MAANKLAAVLDRILATPDDATSWIDLLRFSYACLAVPEGRGGKRHFSNLTSKVNKALDAFPSTILRNETTINQPNIKKTNTKDNIAARISEKLEDGDVRGAIRLASSDDIIAPHDEQTFAVLLKKHPPRAMSSQGLPTTAELKNSHQPLVLQEADVTVAIKSFVAGSAGGLDGLRPQHLKDMISVNNEEAGHRLLSSLTDFANFFLAGNVPSYIRPIFCGASLCALNKKDGGIRPIAVGCTLRRLVAKAAAKKVQEKMAKILAPTQLGVGIKQGTEAAAHAARLFLSNIQPGQALLKLDFSNAFNTLSRGEILRIVDTELPELYPFVSTCYSASTCLNFGDYLIRSDEGVQQGDPLGPLLFCISTLKLAKSLKAELNLWYMDDGALGGAVHTLKDDFELVRRLGSEIGLVLNEQKCEIITDDPGVVAEFRSIAPEILHIKTADATLLGAPIGNLIGIEAALAKKICEFKRVSDRLKILNAHDAFFLLKNCFSLPKLQYILRCAPCFSSKLLEQFDLLIHDSLRSILNIDLTESAWNQATLPVRNGGIGIRLASQVALPSFLSSVASSSDLIMKILPSQLHSSAGFNDNAFVTAADEWKIRSGLNQLPSLLYKQKAWDTPLVDVALEKVLSAASNQAGIARLTAAAAPHSGAFLQALPSSAVGT